MLKGKPFQRDKPLYWRNNYYDFQIALMEGDWKRVGNSKRTKFELYNLKADLGEVTNLSKLHPEQFQQMKAKLIAYDREVLDEGPD